ncbi:TPA: hypothetical protein RJR39_000474 [Burkholderia cenocepacia]|nr:hypothetical protein [Burkholderia cenocepacia]HDV6324440.1 hypothetical protein [Burkholderia cenocepacia]HDV6350284.1 hypothetical protein [Burkholderia cenocepacia]
MTRDTGGFRSFSRRRAAVRVGRKAGGCAVQRGQFRRDTTAKLIAIEPVTARGGASSSASPKRKRRLRPSARSARRFGARVSAATAHAFAPATSHGDSATQSAAGSRDMKVNSGKGMSVLNAIAFDR